MERNYKITIPEPCHEKWDKMNPTDNGRFCMSCSKTVIDFSVMLPDEIQHFFIQNRNGSICGRFRKSQLDTITIQIPDRVLYSQTHYHKMFLLALFIAMGTTLFSCADKDGNKQKIDKVEVVETPKSEHINVGDIKISHNDTMFNVPPPPPKTNESKVLKGKPSTQNTRFYKPVTIKCGETKDTIVEDVIYNGGISVIIQPEFKGGINNFYQFFAKEFKLPEDVEKPKAKIIVSFVIEKDGSLSSFEFPQKVDPKIEAEVTRVLKLSPKWQSGEQNGKKTRTKYSLPISFQ